VLSFPRCPHRRSVPPARGRSARLGLRRPTRTTSSARPVARPGYRWQALEERIPELLLAAMAGWAVLTGSVLCADIIRHATVTGVDCAYAPVTVAVAALRVKGLFTGGAALIRPSRRPTGATPLRLSVLRRTVQAR